ANPGALFRANPKTCIVLDLKTGEIKPIIVPVAPKPSANGAPHPPVDEGLGSVMMPILPAIRAANSPSAPESPSARPPAPDPGSGSGQFLVKKGRRVPILALPPPRGAFTTSRRIPDVALPRGRRRGRNAVHRRRRVCG